MNSDNESVANKYEIWEQFSKFFGNYYTIYVVFIVYILNLVAGISFSWTSPILVKLNETVNNPLGKPITLEESDLIGSFFYIGAAIGPVLFVVCLQKFGRKFTISIIALPLPIFYTLLALARNVNLFYICRIFLGFSIGSLCSTIPVYVSEISPFNIRGSLMSLSNTFIQAGSLITYITGPYLTYTIFNVTIAALSLISLIFFVLTCPESPYYTAQTQPEKTRKILENLRKCNVNSELEDIEDGVTTETSASCIQIFNSRKNVKAFIMATFILIIQQLTGINVIIGYSQLIFLETNIEYSSVKCSIIVGSLQVISSLIPPLLSEKFQRKSMLCFSLFGLSVCNFVISAYFQILQNFSILNWIPLITLICFVILDNCGNGPLPWVFLGEIYPMEIKAIGPALSTSIYYVFQFLLTFSFNKIPLGFMFFGFGLFCIFGVFYVKVFLTETQGKTLNEIRDALENEPLKNKS